MYILKATGNSNYMVKNNYKIGFENFSGVVEKLDWNGNFISGEYYESGKVVGTVVESTTNISGRIAGYWKTIYVDWYQQVCDTNGCSDWVFIGTLTRSVYVADDEDPNNLYGTYYYEGGSGGGGGGGTGGGSGCPYSPDCNQQPSIPDYGEVLTDIEVVKTLDVSQYLQPVNPGDNVNMPYEGMKAKDSNGVIYTYNAQYNVWLLPDLVVLLNNGYQIQTTNVPNFGGAVLSTVTTIALVEPTFVGEILVLGLLVYMYEASQVNTVGHNDYPICQKLYEDFCLGKNKGYGQCYDCRDECNSSFGAWPFYKCNW